MERRNFLFTLGLIPFVKPLELRFPEKRGWADYVSVIDTITEAFDDAFSKGVDLIDAAKKNIS